MNKLICLFCLLLASTAFAQADIAPLVNYQGRLTDDAGAPVADGNYDMVFSIYASSGAPAPIWTSGTQSVAVAGGLFAYTLGSAVALPHNIFDNQTRWLGITIGDDAEISPRTRFTASPYSYRALKADTAMSFTGADAYVHTVGDTMTGGLYFDGNGNNRAEGYFLPNTVGSDIYLKSSDTTTTKLFGTFYGELNLLHGINGRLRAALVGSSLGGRLRLYDDDGIEQIELYAGTTGDATMQLPDNSVNADEILDEPGIVSGTGTGPDLTTSSFVDIATVTITTPAAGYVYVIAHCGIILHNTTELNGAYVQIDTTAGGGNISDDAFVFKSGFPNEDTYCDRVFVDKMYFISSARTITFRLEGARYASSTGDVYTSRSRIRAMYFPTSYGSVKSTVEIPGNFQDVETVVLNDGLGNSKVEYQVDLRELELKAKEAKIKALEAELELERARDEAERQDRE